MQKAASVTPGKGKAADAVDTADDLDFVPPSLQKMRDLSAALKGQIDVQSTPPAAVAGGKKSTVTPKQTGAAVRKGAGKAEDHSESYGTVADSLPALEMQMRVDTLQSTIEKMQLDSKKKQDSYLRREAQYSSPLPAQPRYRICAINDAAPAGTRGRLTA